MKRFVGLSIATALALSVAASTAMAAEGGKPPKQQAWSFQGLFGDFDNHELQRGYQVYAEICVACHSLKYIAFRHLEGIGLNEEQIKALAGTFTITDGPDEFGDPFDRPGLPSDFLPNPFPNDEAARAANGGAMPPDLSLIVPAFSPRWVPFGDRHHGADYVYSVLTGYDEEVPADFEVQEGSSYNPFFRGSQIGMPAPLFEDMVEYADGTPATLSQMSRDVSAFLTWASDPQAQERKALGFKVIIFLLFLTGIFYAVKRKVWADLH